MQRVVEQLVAIRQLDDAAEIHHGYTLTEMPHHRQIVGDEQVGEAEALAQISDHNSAIPIAFNASLRGAALGGATLARVTVNGTDFNGTDLASTRLIEPIGLDAAKNFDKAQNMDRLLRE
jgi:hypothetical protein